MADRYVIQGLKERDDETGKPLFWSNKDGWGALEGATRFTENQKRGLNLPIDGTWVRVPDAEGKCPNCGGDLHYEGSEPDGLEEVAWGVGCPKCGWAGKEYYKLTFEGHSVSRG